MTLQDAILQPSSPFPPLAAATAKAETSPRYRDNVFDSDCEKVRVIAESSGFFSTEEVEVAVELVQERLSKGPRSGYNFLFAEICGRMAGYICYGPVAGARESFYLYWIAVDNELRGKGLGRALIGRVEAEIARLGGRRAWIETSGRAQYQPTLAFYQARGYRPEALLPNFYASGDDKLIYMKIL
jgi:ribosomal protein S18 acetylase RimI-like enzyme